MRRADKKGTMKDYFNILGITPNASEDDIKRAYRSLAMKHHPDRGGDQQKFQEIQEAYSVLTDPQKRAEWEAAKHGNPFGHPGGFHFNFNFGNQGHPFDINDIFTHFNGDPFGGFRQQQQRRNRDLKVVVELDLASTLEPQKKHISVKHINGTRHTVTIDIPKGVNSSVQMKYAGHGDNSYPDLPPGDLYLQFRVQPHADFAIEGLDLVKSIKVNCLDAMLGTALRVHGLDGKEFDVNIPQGIQHGFRMRIAQQGLWALDHPIRGSLILHIEIHIPTDFTNDQIAALETLNNHYREHKGYNK